MPRTLGQALAFLVGLWLALVLLRPLVASAAGDPALEQLEAQLEEAVNAVRVRQHLIPLRRDPALDAVARGHSVDMASRHYLAHETPEGLDPVDRLQSGGVQGFSLAGENVGMTDRGSPNDEILNGWLASKVHRDNLLAPAFNTTGIGIGRAADGTFYYTQVYVTFPRP
jgi:uncharacterized protein YkwD